MLHYWPTRKSSITTAHYLLDKLVILAASSVPAAPSHTSLPLGTRSTSANDLSPVGWIELNWTVKKAITELFSPREERWWLELKQKRRIQHKYWTMQEVVRCPQSATVTLHITHITSFILHITHNYTLFLDTQNHCHYGTYMEYRISLNVTGAETINM